MIPWYITWRDNHAYDERLRQIADRAKVPLIPHLAGTSGWALGR